MVSTTRKPAAIRAISHSRNLTDGGFNQTPKDIASFGARYARDNRGEMRLLLCNKMTQVTLLNYGER